MYEKPINRCHKRTFDDDAIVFLVFIISYRLAITPYPFQNTETLIRVTMARLDLDRERFERVPVLTQHYGLSSPS